MPEITEIFIMSMKHPENANPIREAARADFTSLEGVTSWKTFVTTDPDRPTLFAEIFTFPDHATASKITPEFAKRQKSRAFLAEVDEILVGQYFAEHQPASGEMS